MIKEGSKVGMEYTLRLDDGTVADTNVGGDPLVYEHGAGMIIPGLEIALEGLGVGDEKKVSIEPKDGYGELMPDSFEEIPLNMIPEESRVVGSMLQAKRAEDEAVVNLCVKEIKEDTIIVDSNHPLAGKTLSFEVKILSVD